MNYRFVPVPSELNRYLLRVEELPAGRYTVRADGRGVGTFTARQLADGINIASSTADAWQPGGPWDAQACVVKELTEARHNLAAAGMLSRAYLEINPLPDSFSTDLQSTDEAIVELQRLTARPQAYHFEIRLAAKEKTP